MREPMQDDTLKHLLEEAQPIYQKAFAALDSIVDICAERQGKEFNMDVSWEILIDFMNGDMVLDECIRLLNGPRQLFYERYQKLLGEADTDAGKLEGG